MKRNKDYENRVVTLFICCLTEDLIDYYNPTLFLRSKLSKIKEPFIRERLATFLIDQQEYTSNQKSLLRSLDPSEADELFRTVGDLITSYASQTDHPGFYRALVHRYEQLMSS